MADGKEYISKVSEEGSVNISEDVISIIALEAMREVEGYGSISNPLSKDLAELIGKKSAARGVSVQPGKAASASTCSFPSSTITP